MGITCVYLPLGAVIAAPRVWEPFWRPGAGLFRHGYTYSGHATVSAAALANLDVMQREGLLDRAASLEGELAVALAPLEKHPSVAEVRSGTGVLAAVQLAPDVLAEEPGAAGRLMLAARRRGIMSRALAPGALQVSPPLVLDHAEVQELAAGLDGALEDLEAGR
jgi:adenosylmethionine-8-amino-7-oxononanoate aminotransferase